MFERHKKESSPADVLAELSEAEGAAAARVRDIEQGIRDENARIAQAREDLDREALLASRERLADLNARLGPAHQAVAELQPKLAAARQEVQKARIQAAREQARELALKITQPLEPIRIIWQEYRKLRQEFEREFPAEPRIVNLDDTLECVFGPSCGLSQAKALIENAWPNTLPPDDPVRRKLEAEREHLKSLEMQRSGPVYGSAWS